MKRLRFPHVAVAWVISLSTAFAAEGPLRGDDRLGFVWKEARSQRGESVQVAVKVELCVGESKAQATPRCASLGKYDPVQLAPGQKQTFSKNSASFRGAEINYMIRQGGQAMTAPVARLRVSVFRMAEPQPALVATRYLDFPPLSQIPAAGSPFLELEARAGGESVEALVAARIYERKK